MRSVARLMVGAAFVLSAPASAATFFYNGGNYVPGTTAPEPLQSPDVVEINTGANKIFTGVTFTNQSGTVNWNAGALFLGSAAQIVNQSLWNLTGDNSLNNNGGAMSIFNNSGIFRKNGGIGSTTIGGIAFVNSGTIDVQTGLIDFNGGNATFNAGSIFSGAGQTNINSNASFNGGFTSSNLDFAGGTFTGNAAALTGAADWEGGTFAGSWTVNGGSTLTATTGANKLFNAATFTNNGTIDWTGGTSFYAVGTQLINNGLIDFAASSSLNNNGGAISTITNNASGVFQIDAGATVTMNNTFVNNGGTITSDGIFNFNNGTATFNNGTVFDGTGTSAINSSADFNGAISSTNLDFVGGTFTGTGATLSGLADWAGGTFSGDWNLTAGSTLTATTGNNKLFSAATFTNNGTIDWTGGASFFASNSQLVNNGVIDFAASSSLNNNGGAISTITNSATGLLIVDAGQTVTMNNTFVNNGGTITTDGILNFNNGTATFNTGTVFNGSGTSAINNSADFNGAASSTNLDFNAGTFTGTGASLGGTADWASGTFAGNWTLTNGSTLTALTGANKLFSGATFTNNGTIDWTGGASFYAAGTQLINNGLIDFAASSSLNNNGGAISTITNGASGVFNVDAGATVTMNNTFVNNGGTLTADGVLNFNNGTATFNNGTVFNGAGTSAINNSAAFNGATSSTNLDFNAGTFTGTGASLSGAVDWAGGTFTGGWNIVSGATMTLVTGGNKLLNAAGLTNNGTVNWLAGNLFASSGTQIVNNGTVTATGDNGVFNNGGAASGIVNNGLIQKTAGAGTTTLSSIGLDNNGTINVLSGTIALPGAFANDGTLGGIGTFTSANLTNNGIIAPGAPGATGTLALTGNYIQTALGGLNTQLASTGSFDFFRVSGNAQLGGTLNLSCIFTCAINTGDSFVILKSFGALAGTFSNVTTSGFLNGFNYNVIYDYAGDNVRLDILNAGMANPPGGVPEPATWVMMLFGFGVIGSSIRRRRRSTIPQFA